MQRRSRKRKQTEVQAQPSPPIKSTGEPFPNHPLPTPEDCRAVRDDLLALHGFPKEFAKYRLQRLNGSALIPAKPEPFDGEDDQSSSGSNESVLDGLVSTVLSQNTTDVNSHRAFASLKSAFPTWEDVLAAESKSVENAIRCGGLAPTKASCIKNVLSCLLEKKGKLCLEYLRDLSVDEIKAELSQFRGIGPKTVACVLMFQLQKDDFPVDTHVFQIAKAIGWVPEAADTKKTYLHLNRRIPNELKFDLNCLLFTHGKLCQKCTKRGGNLQKRESFPCLDRMISHSCLIVDNVKSPKNGYRCKHLDGKFEFYGYNFVPVELTVQKRSSIPQRKFKCQFSEEKNKGFVE